MRELVHLRESRGILFESTMLKLKPRATHEKKTPGKHTAMPVDQRARRDDADEAFGWIKNNKD